ncbi:MAG: peptidase M20 [Desulfobacterales bacterium]|nr:MAG: peptidase M20 [Desulfobacterales bacterium]
MGRPNILERPEGRKIRNWFQGRDGELFALLKELVEIQSGSFHKAGVDAVGRAVARSAARTSLAVEFVSRAGRGDHVIFRSPAAVNLRSAGSEAESAGPPRILMVGHMDTVFPEDTDFRDYREEGETAYGPGVIDMKGGLAAGIFALKALDAAGLLDRLPATFVFNSDEEIGSPSSLDLIAAEADRADLALVFEAGGLNGDIVTGRKGNLSIRVDVHGKAGHAAFAGPDKASAIAEIARKILAVEALNDPERGVTANAGTVEGGIGPNTVPDFACSRMDFRFVEPADQKRIAAAVEEIVTKNAVPGVTSAYTVASGRPSMPPTQGNRKLYRIFADIAEALGMTAPEEFRQGVSDANQIAARGVPVIDGLGPVGAKDHSKDEYMIRKTLPERALLTALGMADLAVFGGWG